VNRKDDFIAVFDSGVGGISVLRHLMQQMPGERFYYFGDSANAPYGTKSKEEVRQLSFAAADYLKGKGIKALVIACNTATSAAVQSLREANPHLIVIGIEPALKLAADTFPGGNLGVMATPMTLKEEKFARLLERFSQDNTIFKIPAPGLVELIEAGKADSPEAEALLRPLFADLPQLDALVLGCTHYPFAKEVLTRLLPGTALLDGGEGTARETKRRLSEAGLLHDGESRLVMENSKGDGRLIDLSYELLR